MGKYIGIRLVHSLVILAIVIVLVFIIARLIPGDAIMAAMAGSVDLHDAEVVERVRHQFGLDQPIAVQFAAIGIRAIFGKPIAQSKGHGAAVLRAWHPFRRLARPLRTLEPA